MMRILQRFPGFRNALSFTTPHLLGYVDNLQSFVRRAAVAHVLPELVRTPQAVRRVPLGIRCQVHDGLITAVVLKPICEAHSILQQRHPPST
jgi:hypothetical protein